MDDINLDEFLQETEPTVNQTSVQSTDNQGVDLAKFLQDSAPALQPDGSPMPSFADGSTPLKPLNSSPVSAMDRFKLSLGNKEGNFKFLTERFPEGVAEDDDGELIVKDQGKWKRVDAKDPWTSSSELSKDIADLGGVVIQGIGAVGTELLLGIPTAGAGAVAGAGLANAAGAGLKMTLGRYVGTYEADATEELRDLAFEGLLGAAGQKVIAGVKPTAQFIGKALGDAAPWLKRIPEAGREAWAKYLNITTGAGEKEARTLIENAAEVGSTIKQYKSAAGSDMANALKENSVEQMKLIGDNGNKALNNLHNTRVRDIYTKVGEDFNLTNNQVLGQSYADHLSKGLLKVERAEGPQEITGELLSQIKSGNFRGLNVTLKSQKELLEEAAAGKLTPDVAEAVINDDSYKLLSDFYKMANRLQREDTMEIVGATVPKLSNLTQAKMASKQIIEMRKILSNTIYGLNEKATDQGLNAVRPILKDFLSTADTLVKDSLDKATDGAYTKYLADYSEFASTLGVFKSAQRAAREGNLQPMESLLNKYNSAEGRNIATKNSVQKTVDLIAQHSDNGAAVKSALRKIDINSAASAFSPIIRSGVIGKGAALGAAGAAISGSIPAGGALLGATSPRLNAAATKYAITAARGVKELLATMKPQDRLRFLNDPGLMNAILSNVVNVPETVSAVEEQLLGPRTMR